MNDMIFDFRSAIWHLGVEIIVLLPWWRPTPGTVRSRDRHLSRILGGTFQTDQVENKGIMTPSMLWHTSCKRPSGIELNTSTIDVDQSHLLGANS
jgi:hypothetical protein